MTKKRATGLMTTLLVCLCIGWWIGHDSVSVVQKPSIKIPSPLADMVPHQIERENQFSTRPRGTGLAWDDEAKNADALLNQRSIVFSSQEALEKFLKKAGNRIRVMGRIDPLNALRVAFLDKNDLSDLLDGSEQLGMIFPVYTPSPQGGSVQDDAVPLGDKLLSWLGLSSANSLLGSGVKIAMLDSGVAPHSTFTNDIKNYLMVDVSQNPSDWSGHGTSVASLIVGHDPLAPGVAPGASLSSYLVANESGTSDTWTLANAIMQAVNAGNQLINISMGSYGDSVILSNAVKYASEKGALIIASSGNDGYTYSAYPGAYSGVVNAFAVDALNNHLLFSNDGQELGFSAPGYKVNAAYPNETYIAFSGTSASAPIITGALAAVMSISQANGKTITPQRALEYLSYYANEAGVSGNDTATGQGAVNLGRYLNSSNPNIQDIAVASNFITAPVGNANASVQVNVENRGTQAMLNVPLVVTLPNGTTKQFSIPSLAANQVKSVTVPLPNNLFETNANITVSSQVTTSDMANFNNSLSTKYSAEQK